MLCVPRRTLRLPRIIYPQRYLFSFPKLPETGPQTYREEKLLRYSPEELYRVVSDVASYKCFIPFCTDSRILKRGTRRVGDKDVLMMDAELTVGFLNFQESYVSEVTCVPFESVQAVAAPTTLFHRLTTTWRFQQRMSPKNSPSANGVHDQLHETQTAVTLELEFAFQNPLHAAVSASFFGQVSKEMVGAFEKRCHNLYQ